MTAYTIENDPYLSAKTKSEIVKHKANGVDMSLVEQFLLNTVPLVAPITNAKRSLAPVAVSATIISILGFVSFLSWMVSGDPIWCARYLVGVLAVLLASGIVALINDVVRCRR